MMVIKYPLMVIQFHLINHKNPFEIKGRQLFR